MGKVTSELTKKQAIWMIIDDRMDFNFIIFCNKTDEEMENEFVELEDAVDRFKEECEEFQLSCAILRKELEEKPFHEILEIGEKKGLWKQGEKQKRLL